MAAVHIQNNAATGAGTSLSVSFSANCGAGNFCVYGGAGDADVTSYTGTPTAPGIAVSVLDDTVTFLATEIAYVPNVSAATMQITRNTAATANMALACAEYSGVVTVSPADKIAASVTTFGTAASSGATATLAQANELIIGVTSATASLTYTPGATFTERRDTGSVRSLELEDKSVTATTAVTATSTLSTSSNWHCLCATFKEAAVALLLEQEGYRWRNDDGSETTATWKAAQDTSMTAPTGVTVRGRFLLNATGDPSSMQPKVQYRKQGAAAWRNVDKFV